MHFLKTICEDNGIHVHEMDERLRQHLGRRLGCALMVDGEYNIVYDGAVKKHVRNYILAHELGHVLLGHLEEEKYNQKANEIEADIFAAVMLGLSLFSEYKDKEISHKNLIQGAS